MPDPVEPAESAAVLWTRADLIIALIIALAGGLGAALAVRAHWAKGNVSYFYQAEFGPAVMVACGRGFHNPLEDARPPEPAPAGVVALADFLDQRRPDFDCASLPSGFQGGAPRMFQAGHRYLMTLAGLTWKVCGVRWTALAWLIGLFAAASAGLGYLFLRAGMARWMAIALAMVWASSPLQLFQMPQMRDYAKAPFFVFLLCAVAWIARTRASRTTTIAAMAIVGAVFGFGFGVRTDVASYLPFAVVAVIAFRPRLTRADVVTRIAGAAAAIAMFFIVASPIIRLYTERNNLAHVAILGLTDPSRDWLELNAPSYSYGYLYNDGYVATMIAAYTERTTHAARSILLGTGDYAFYGNEYYGRLLRMFPGDTLTRAWAAVIGVLDLPFRQDLLSRPSWLPASLSPLYEGRALVMSWLGVVPPFVVAALLAVAIGAGSIRLALLFLLFGCLLAGSTSLQFQERHTFQLELLPLWIIGCAVSGIVAGIRGGWLAPSRWVGARPRAIAAVALAIGMVAAIIVPISASRRYQGARVTDLLSSYESAATEPVPMTVSVAADPRHTLIETPLAEDPQAPRYVDSNMLVVDLGGEQCDYDVVSLTYRYRAVAPYTDLSRQTVVPIPPLGNTVTHVLFPVFSLGSKMPPTDTLAFVGLEMPTEQRSCLVQVRRFSQIGDFPVLIETVMQPDWRRERWYETFRDFERINAEWMFESYAIPAGDQPGRHALAQLQTVTATPTYRSPLVKALTPDRIDVGGTPPNAAAYLLTWPYQRRQAGSRFFVEGEVFEGGLTVGIQQNEKWVQQLNVYKPGRFRAVVRVDDAGDYGAILANHLTRGRRNRLTVTRYGWLPPAQ